MKEGGRSPKGILQREVGSAGGIHSLCLSMRAESTAKLLLGLLHEPSEELKGAPRPPQPARSLCSTNRTQELLPIPGNKGLLSGCLPIPGAAEPPQQRSRRGRGALLEGAEWE